MDNTLSLSAKVIQEDSLRYTPAGVAILGLELKHTSEKTQDAFKRKVEFVIKALLVNKIAQDYAGQLLGENIKAVGFLVKPSLLSTKLVFHIQQITVIKD